VDVGDLAPVSDYRGAAYKTAKASSGRGDIVIRLGLGRRSFSISLDSSQGVFVWASGETGDLVEVVGLMGAWREGAPLREICARFPFMSYPRLSQGYGDGNPVGTQWEILLDDERRERHRKVLVKLHTNDHLRTLFSSFSHGVLCLARDCFDRDAGEICVDERPDGSYRLWASYDETRRVAQGIEAVADTAEALLEGFQA